MSVALRENTPSNLLCIHVFYMNLFFYYFLFNFNDFFNGCFVFPYYLSIIQLAH